MDRVPSVLAVRNEFDNDAAGGRASTRRRMLKGTQAGVSADADTNSICEIV